jgi:hypothetical protein
MPIMKKRFLLVALAATIAATSNFALATSEQPLDFIGAPAPEQARPDQVIVITDATRYVHVTAGSTVCFVVDGQSFSWSFDNSGASVIPFNLARIAPKGLLRHTVEVHVADNPLYQG